MKIIKTTRIRNGKIYLPKEVRQEFELKEGDKVIFLVNEKHELILSKNREEAKRKFRTYTSSE